mgnify:CR=1 FL=1
MKIAIFDDFRFGTVPVKEIVDVTQVLMHHGPGFAVNFWLRMCQNF